MTSRLSQDTTFTKRLLAGGLFAMLPAPTSGGDTQFGIRLFYHQIIAEMVDQGIRLAERELIAKIIDEHTLSAGALDTLIPSDGIIELIPDSNLATAQPRLYLKALKRDGGALVAQTSLVMNASLSANAIAAVSADAMGFGEDDSVESAIRDYNRRASISDPLELIFKAYYQIGENSWKNYSWDDSNLLPIRRGQRIIFDDPWFTYQFADNFTEASLTKMRRNSIREMLQFDNNTHEQYDRLFGHIRDLSARIQAANAIGVGAKNMSLGV